MDAKFSKLDMYGICLCCVCRGPALEAYGKLDFDSLESAIIRYVVSDWCSFRVPTLWKYGHTGSLPSGSMDIQGPCPLEVWTYRVPALWMYGHTGSLPSGNMDIQGHCPLEVWTYRVPALWKYGHTGSLSSGSLDIQGPCPLEAVSYTHLRAHET